MKLNVKAWDLRSELFALVGKFKALQQAAHNDGQYDASTQIGGVACHLAEIHADLPDVFIDAARDSKDQEYPAILA